MEGAYTQWKQELEAQNKLVRTLQGWKREVEAKRQEPTNHYTKFEDLFRKE